MLVHKRLRSAATAHMPVWIYEDGEGGLLVRGQPLVSSESVEVAVGAAEWVDTGLEPLPTPGAEEKRRLLSVVATSVYGEPTGEGV